MERPWIQSYPPGVPADIPVDDLVSIGDYFLEAVARYPHRHAFISGTTGATMDYAELEGLTRDLAAWFQKEIALPPGSRVALMMPNLLQYPVCLFALLRAGYVVVNVNPMYTPRELAHQLKDSGATAMVVVDLFAHVLEQVIASTPVRHVVVTGLADMLPAWKRHLAHFVIRRLRKMVRPYKLPGHVGLRQALQRGSPHTLDPVPVRPNDVAFLQYTGGTTGVSKGAMLSHGNLVLNTLQLISMCGDYMRPGKEIVVTALPLYHIFAFTINLLGFWHLGAKNLLVPSPRPPSNLKRVFENYKVTWVTGVNTLFNALLNERWFTDSPPKHLRASAAGGMALHESVSERWRKLTGTPIVEGYGLTESSPVLTFNPLGGGGRDGTIGIPVPSTLVKCVSEDGSEVAVGEPGELLAKGPQIMQGYWNRPEDSAHAVVDGWLKTGDIATVDADGFFTIVDRKKDMILVSGFNVYPNEVEEQIAALEGIQEVGVIGVPSDKTGERVLAFVVTGSNPPSEADVIAHCRESLAAYKIPSAVEFVSELPKSPIGKILRKDLRALWLAQQNNASPNQLKG